MDMMTLALRSMGIDGDALLNQAKQIGGAFQTIGDRLAALDAKLDRLEANQHAVMGHMGLYVPPPSGDALIMIDAESAAYARRAEEAAQDAFSHEADMGAGRLARAV